MQQAAANDAPIEKGASLHRVIIATSIGNALEYFDLTVYASFALIISKVFFPTGNETVSLMLALGTFAISYLARPLGALVLGAYADRHGRNAALLISISLMVLGTAIVGLMPSYAQIGVIAPLGILMARLLQGFSAGGEFGSATAMLAEYEPKRRGFMASWQFASQGFSMMAAAGFGAFLTASLTADQLHSWGWRVPFLFGLLIGPVGFYIRRNLKETVRVDATPQNQPVRTVLTQQKARLALSVGLFVLSTTATYMIIYMPSYAARQLHIPLEYSFLGAVIPSLIILVLTPFIGHWSDRVGRVRIMLGAGVVYTLTIIPMFLLLDHFRSVTMLVLATLWIGVAKTVYMAPFPALMASLFPTETRGTGMSLGYSLGTTIFGSFTPLIVTSLMAATQSSLAPSYYLFAAGVLSLGSLLYTRHRLQLH